MSELDYAIDADALQPGEVSPVQIGETWYAICNDDGTFRATDILCPHAEASLGSGEVRDGCVVCATHHWPWDLKTGLTDPKTPWLRLKVYRCEVHDGKVFVDLSRSITDNNQ